jgi:hypothetical protein
METAEEIIKTLDIEGLTQEEFVIHINAIFRAVEERDK